MNCDVTGLTAKKAHCSPLSNRSCLMGLPAGVIGGFRLLTRVARYSDTVILGCAVGSWARLLV